MSQSLPSVMGHAFSRVPNVQVPRTTFNRSHGYKTTFDSGYLVPVFVDEALPGDTFNVRMSAFARLATPIRPFMDNLFLDSFFFAVPLRLLWDNFKKQMGEQDAPEDSTDYITPYMTSPAGGYSVGSLHDYFGIPTGIADLEHSVYFHRAYNFIWNTWFRDQNLQDPVTFSTDDGPDDPADYELLRRGKRHDYFTSCLPWPQKGEPVGIPIGDTAPIKADHDDRHTWKAYETDDGSQPVSQRDLQHSSTGYLRNSYGDALYFDPNGSLYADLSEAVAATVNDLRMAFQLQRLFERDARSGTRYIEMVKAHFGVTSPDFRMQRPEYLGGGSAPIIVNPVAQTSSTDATTPQGNLAAIGSTTIRGHGFVKSFTEHCVIIGLVNVRADLNYQQGLDRMFSRQTRYDHYWPVLAQIGEQAVLNKEIYAQGNSQDDEAFGYQERYGEYRYKNSKITGQFRSTYAQSLDIWHLAQDFDSLPVLNSEFIVDDPPVDRVIAVQDEPQFLFDGYFHMKCARPMPMYGVPGQIDHF
jgi:hypothetical protein